MNYNRVTIAENKTPLLIICDDEEGNFLQVPETFASVFSSDVQRASFEVNDGILYVRPITDDAVCAFGCGEYDYRDEAEEQGHNPLFFLREIVNCVLDETLCTEAVWAITDALLASGEEVHLAIKHRAQA